MFSLFSPDKAWHASWRPLQLWRVVWTAAAGPPWRQVEHFYWLKTMVSNPFHIKLFISIYFMLTAHGSPCYFKIFQRDCNEKTARKSLWSAFALCCVGQHWIHLTLKYDYSDYRVIGLRMRSMRPSGFGLFLVAVAAVLSGVLALLLTWWIAAWWIQRKLHWIGCGHLHLQYLERKSKDCVLQQQSLQQQSLQFLTHGAEKIKSRII